MKCKKCEDAIFEANAKADAESGGSPAAIAYAGNVAARAAIAAHERGEHA